MELQLETRFKSVGIKAERGDSPRDLTDILAQLDSEPLTHLMLGHRELFHSNLLAWFFKQFPDASDRVFGAFTLGRAENAAIQRKVEREQKNLDLYFQWPDRHPLVIENKVFSLPDETQLYNYTSRAKENGDTPVLWLLSLCDPNWPGNRKVINYREWRWLSYQELTNRIRSALPKDDHSYSAQTIHHYANVIELLSKLVAKVVVANTNETVALPDDTRNVLSDSRLISSMEKLRAESVAQRVRQTLPEEMNGIPVKSGFAHGAPLLDWFCPVNLAPDARAGWQLQDGQFRLALILPHLAGTSEQKIRDRFQFAKMNENLFDFSYLDEHLDTAGKSTLPPSNKFGRYNPAFVYRYKKVSNLTVIQLKKAAYAVAHRLSNVVEHKE